MNQEYIRKISLEGRRVLAAGAGKGIGAATALMLADQGASVLSVSRKMEDLKLLEEKMYGKGHSFLESDLTTEAGIQLLGSRILDWGQPDIIVACFSKRSRSKRISKQSVSDWARLNEDILYLIHILPSVLEYQRRNRFGRWIGISSSAASVFGPGQSLYSSKKNLLLSLFSTLAVEEGKNGITANIISPGIIDTPGVQDHYSEEIRNVFSGMNCIGRAGTAEEVASAVCFFANPLSSFVTGVNLPVSGGFELGWSIQSAVEGKIIL